VTDDKAYRNPVDGKTYVARSSWKNYEPKTRRPDDPARKVNLEQVVLLTPQPRITERTTTVELIAFLREAEKLADQSFGTSGKSFRVMAQFKCEPGGHAVKLTHQGEATQELLDHYYTALVSADKLPVTHGDVSFLIELSIRP
jgi:hypothetical protein